MLDILHVVPLEISGINIINVILKHKDILIVYLKHIYYSIFFADNSSISLHDYLVPKSTSSDHGSLSVSLIFNKIMYLNYFSNCSEYSHERECYTALSTILFLEWNYSSQSLD